MLSPCQFERTLIVAEDDSYVSYLEGCTAPAYDENQLHAAVVEIYAGKNAEVKYSTVQNWYAGQPAGKVSITLSQNAAYAKVTTRKFLGHKSKPVVHVEISIRRARWR